MQKFSPKNIVNFLAFILPIILGLACLDIEFNNDKWLAQDNKIDIDEKFKNKTFLDNKESLIIKIKNKDGFFNQKNIDSLKIFQEKLAEIDGVESVKSPLKLHYIKKTGEALSIKSFENALENDIKNLAEFQEIFYKQTYADEFISKDEKTFIIEVLTSLKDENKHAARKKIINEINKINNFSNYSYSGKLFLDYELNEISKNNLIKLLLLSFALIALILALIYKNIVKLFTTIYVSITASFISILAIKLINGYITALSIILPLTIAAIALTDNIHILSKWQYLCEKFANLNKKLRFKKLVKLTYLPCLMTSITTAIGYGSFYFSEILPLKNFAIASIISIFLAYIIIVGLSWILIYFNDDKNFTSDKELRFIFIKNLIPKIVKFTTKRRKSMLLALFFIVAFFAYQLKNAYTESNFLDIFFKKNSSTYQSFIDIDNNLQGSGQIDIILTSKNEDYFKSISNMNLIANLQKKLQEHHLVLKVNSYLEPLKMLHKELTNGKKLLPQNNQELEQEILFLQFSKDENNDDLLAPYLDFNSANSRLVVKTKNLNSKEIEELINFIEKNVNHEHFLSGYNNYFYQVSNYATKTQLSSILATSITIFFIVFLVYSLVEKVPFILALKIAAIAIIMDFIPTIITAGIIAKANISFDLATVMIAAISFSISTDNLIHLIDANNNFLKDQNPIVKTLQYVYLPLIINTIIFCLSFIIFVFSDLVLMNKFGLFSFVTIFLALIVNLVISPLFLRKSNF